jgi:hypothetical protein
LQDSEIARSGTLAMLVLTGTARSRSLGTSTAKSRKWDCRARELRPQRGGESASRRVTVALCSSPGRRSTMRRSSRSWSVLKGLRPISSSAGPSRPVGS